MQTVVEGKPVPFPQLLDAEANLNEVARALRAEVRRIYDASRTIPKGPPPVRAPMLNVQIDLLPGQAQANGVRHARYLAGSPPRIIVEVEGHGAYDQLNELELVSFWDNVLYELQNARYDRAIRLEKRAPDPVKFGFGRAEREAYATIFHLRSLARLLSQAGTKGVVFANALGVSARRAIKFADYPGDRTELERRFTSTPHRAHATTGTRYALSSADMYAYEWLIDQEPGQVAKFLIGTAFSDERWTGLEEIIVAPVDKELERRWQVVGVRTWKKPKLFFDVAAWTIEQATNANGAIAMGIGSYWNGRDKGKYPTPEEGARAAAQHATTQQIPGKLALAGRLPASLTEVANHEFGSDADPTAGGPPPEDVVLNEGDVARFLQMVDGLKALPEPV